MNSSFKSCHWGMLRVNAFQGKLRGILKGKCVVFLRKARAAQKYALRTENSHFHKKADKFQIYVLLRATVPVQFHEFFIINLRNFI